MKKTDWVSALKLKTHMIKICFMIIIKHVIRNVINQSNQKIIVIEINMQNFRIHDMMKILHVEHSKKSAQDDVKADILIINVMTLQQKNILIQKRLILQEVLHNIEVFHWDCLIICCYQCQWYNHMIKICRFIQRCRFCAETNHKDSQCSVKNEEEFSCCSNCNEAHSAWAELYKNLQKVKKHAIHTYNNQSTCFAVNIKSKIKNDFNSD